MISVTDLLNRFQQWDGFKNFSDEDVSGFATMYVKEHYEGEPVTTQCIAECFENAFKLGAKCNMMSSATNQLKIGELFVQQGEMLFHYGDKVAFIRVIVDEVDHLTSHNDHPTQVVETHYVFDNVDRTVISSREMLVMYDGRTPIPAGSYDLSDYLIQKALHDKTN